MTNQAISFAIFRIIGNSLPPRHSQDNTLRTTSYILENEEEFEGCEKIWVLNKIVDRKDKTSLLNLLRERNQKFIDIPFDVDAHFNTFLDVTGAPVALRFSLKEQTVYPHIAAQLEEWKIRHKSQRLVGINEARNIALKLGRSRYDWSVIADGGVIFSKQGWNNFVVGVTQEQPNKIAIIQMYRVYEWKSLEDYAPDGSQEEPQIAFHRASEEVFDPVRRYGNQNKAELLARLGVPGPWQEWRPASWEIRHPYPAPNFKNFVVAGFVYRLPTNGVGEETSSARFVNRFYGVQNLSFSIDVSSAHERRNVQEELLPRFPETISDDALSSVKHFIDEVLIMPDLFVTDKNFTAPSGDTHDYYSVAPHYSSAGLKYDSYTNDEDRVKKCSDAEAFRNFAWRVYAYSVGGVILRQPQLSQKAVNLIKSWFVDSKTKMNPNVRYAQIIPRSDKINEVGVIELRQLINVVSAAKVLLICGALEGSELQMIKNWIQLFLDDCDNCAIREKALQRKNNIGTWSAVLFGTLDLFCDRYPRSFSIAYQAAERLGQQLGPFSVQLNEIGRAMPLHYCLFNLAAWFELSQLCREFGIDLYRFSGVHNESLRNALQFCSENRKQHSDYSTNSREYDFRIDTLKSLYEPTETRKIILVPTPHWGLRPIVFA